VPHVPALCAARLITKTVQTMVASDLLVFRLRSSPDYLVAGAMADSDLASVSKRTVFLSLEGARVTDEGLALLPELPQLRGIDLDSTLVTDHGLESLCRFASLEEIWLEDTSVTDAGVLLLRRLPSLRFLSLAYCDVSKTTIDILRKTIQQVET
jgi:hypothetical protein